MKQWKTIKGKQDMCYNKSLRFWLNNYKIYDDRRVSKEET